MRIASVASALALGFSLVAAAPAALAAQTASPTLLTPRQQQIDRAAADLVKDPQVVAARAEIRQLWAALPAAQLKDGQSQLDGAVDELVFFSARNAVERKQFAPSVVWAIAAPYPLGGVTIPGSRFGIDDPDRIYRSATVDPAQRYVIRGQRSAQPSNDDFLFEVVSKDLKTIGALPAKQIDVAADGSFTVSVDATPANGRRNHLTLPANTTGLLIRDTLADWGGQLPNRLSIEQLGGAPAKPAAIAEVRAETIALIREYGRFNAGLLGLVAKGPVNQVVPHVRTLESGVEGAIVATNAFHLADDETLVVTIDRQGAGYVGLQLTDPWARSLPFWDSTGSLSDRQAKANADGTITYVIAPRDPGYANWVSTGGLNDGYLALRVENFATIDPARLVRGVQVVKATQLATTLPAGAVRITPAQRAQELATRKAGYEKRLTY